MSLTSMAGKNRGKNQDQKLMGNRTSVMLVVWKSGINPMHRLYNTENIRFKLQILNFIKYLPKWTAGDGGSWLRG